MSLYATSRFGGGGGGGGGSSTSGVPTVTLYDPVDTALPTSAPTVIDGVTVITGTTVLFSNLATGNNEVYQATVTGPTITWAAQAVFPGPSVSPVPGSLVVITQGTAFADTIGTFNGTTWNFNNVVRYFNGTDYFEQDALYTTTLTDNTTNGTVFSVAFLGSQNILVDYSVLRSGMKEAGTIALTTDGVNVGISVEGSATAATGVSYSAIISGPNLILQYTTTSTGSPGSMKYSLKRWSDTSGGPGGPPSYSGGSSTVPAAGSNGDVQINNAGVLGASTNFAFDSVNNLLELGSAQLSILNSTTFLDNQASPVLMFSMPSTYNSVFLHYTVIRGTAVRTGEIQIATDGSIAIGSEEYYTESQATGITLSVTLSGGNINVNYTSTATGIGGTCKYAFERW